MKVNSLVNSLPLFEKSCYNQPKQAFAKSSKMAAGTCAFWFFIHQNDNIILATTVSIVENENIDKLQG